MAIFHWQQLRLLPYFTHFFKRSRLLNLMVVSSIVLSSGVFAADDNQRRASWYRYYDQNGVANLSSSVTPNHIRFGYEALDQNLQVLYKNRPYNADADNRGSSERQLQSLEQLYNQRLKRAYGNSKTATLKREQQLKSIGRQLNFQQQQLRTLMNEKVNYKRQEINYLRKGANVPPSLQQQLNQNEQDISNVRKIIEILQVKLRDTSIQYNKIIARLKALES